MDIQHETRRTALAALIDTAAFAAIFAAYEPSFLAAVGDTFTVSTAVTQEISFETPASNVSLASIPGVSGGTSNGGTQVNIKTNDSAGYTLDIQSSSSPALRGNSAGGTIPDYAPAVAGVPDFAFAVPANSAGFGYTVEASSSSDLNQSFKDNGTACNAGSNDAADKCWAALATTSKTIINRSTATPSSGATTTIKFRLTINSNPSPAIVQDTYTATATLTATAN